MTITDLKFAALAAIMAAAVTGATIAATTPAFGAERVTAAGAAPAVHVAYADLDLGSRDGIARLERRVSFAADSLCVGIGTEMLAARLDELACRRAAIAAAAPQVRHAVEKFAAAHAVDGGAIALTIR